MRLIVSVFLMDMPEVIMDGNFMKWTTSLIGRHCKAVYNLEPRSLDNYTKQLLLSLGTFNQVISYSC